MIDSGCGPDGPEPSSNLSRSTLLNLCGVQNLDPATLADNKGYFNATGTYTVLLPWPSPFMCHLCPNLTYRALGEVCMYIYSDVII